MGGGPTFGAAGNLKPSRCAPIGAKIQCLFWVVNCRPNPVLSDAGFGSSLRVRMDEVQPFASVASLGRVAGRNGRAASIHGRAAAVRSPPDNPHSRSARCCVVTSRIGVLVGSLPVSAGQRRSFRAYIERPLFWRNVRHLPSRKGVKSRPYRRQVSRIAADQWLCVLNSKSSSIPSHIAGMANAPRPYFEGAPLTTTYRPLRT